MKMLWSKKEIKQKTFRERIIEAFKKSKIEKPKQTRWVIWFLAVIFVLALLVGGFFLYKHKLQEGVHKTMAILRSKIENTDQLLLKSANNNIDKEKLLKLKEEMITLKNKLISYL